MTIAADAPSVLSPQVAGGFYPADPAALAALLDREAGRAAPPVVSGAKMIVAPHAGLVFSGRLAATAIRALAPGVTRLVVLGPAHRMAFKGAALHPARQFETPLGRVPVDWGALKALLPLPGVAIDARPFAGEHSIEAPLVMAQRLLPAFALVPVLIGEAEPALVGEILHRLWGGPETAILISSDLSHFLSAPDARAKDGETRRLIETLDGARLTAAHACGWRPLRAALDKAASLDMRATGLDFATSEAVTRDAARVVGYGAVAFDYAARARLSAQDRALLLDAACGALAFAVDHRGAVPVVTTSAPLSPALTATRATFVTVTLDGALRGCIGSVRPHRALIGDVIVNAVKAGFGDPRFAPLTRAELEKAAIHVAILSHPRALPTADEATTAASLAPDRDGAILTGGGRSGLFLPSVWESLPEPADFLRALKRKAGLPAEGWGADYRVERFRAESFGAPFRAPADPRLAYRAK